MNLISCGGCGVVLDKDKLGFPKDIRDEDGAIIDGTAEYDGDEYVAVVPCPVCKTNIREHE